MNSGQKSPQYVSDELTHFVGRSKPTDADRFELLCHILRTGKLGTKPGNMDIDRRLPLTSNKAALPEMVCFCDIPLECLERHMCEYSHFGLAFKKTFMRGWGCSPVYYVSMHSPCTDHSFVEPNDPRRRTTWGEFFEKAFGEFFGSLPKDDKGRIQVPALKSYQNLLLWYVFGHIKFFDSRLPENDSANWYMEREWRIIGSMTFQLEDVARVILPTAFEDAFRQSFPQYRRDLRLVSKPAQPP